MPSADSCIRKAASPSGRLRRSGQRHAVTSSRPFAAELSCQPRQRSDLETRRVSAGHLGADARSPISGECLHSYPAATGSTVRGPKEASTGSGPRTSGPSRSKDRLNNSRPAVFIRGGKRGFALFTAMRRFAPDYRDHVGTLFSDDDGKTWHGFRELFLKGRDGKPAFPTATARCSPKTADRDLAGGRLDARKAGTVRIARPVGFGLRRSPSRLAACDAVVYRAGRDSAQ